MEEGEGGRRRKVTFNWEITSQALVQSIHTVTPLGLRTRLSQTEKEVAALDRLKCTWNEHQYSNLNGSCTWEPVCDSDSKQAGVGLNCSEIPPFWTHWDPQVPFGD